MDLKYTAEEEQFRLVSRQWIGENLPEEFKRDETGMAGTKREERVEWYKLLAAKGWLCPAWPKEHGGSGWTLAQQSIFREEAALQGAPGPDMGISMVGPLLIEYGTEEQRERYLPKIVAGEQVWCQGYSEPNAGSDLASLALKAELDGEDYIVNGQKIWTSNADQADMIFFLARTNPHAEKKQMGISFLVAPMDSPGLRIQPIRQMTDESHFYETFFTDVRVPVANRIGNENEGWTLAKRLLAHERSGLFNPEFKKAIGRLRKLSERVKLNGDVAVKDHAIRQCLAQLHMDLDSLNAVKYRALTRLLRGQMPGPESSVLKVFGSELYQRTCDLAMEVLGPIGQVWHDETFAEEAQNWPRHAARSRAYSIFSGTNEIQRNIISERVLGLPR